jgi:hypothetical protein
MHWMPSLTNLNRTSTRIEPTKIILWIDYTYTLNDLPETIVESDNLGAVRGSRGPPPRSRTTVWGG